MHKRIFAAILALTMAFALLPSTAQAAGATEVTIDGTTYTSPAAASDLYWSLDFTASPPKLALRDGCSLRSISANGDLAIELMGTSTVNSDSSSAIRVTGGALAITGGGTLNATTTANITNAIYADDVVITDSTVNATGSTAVYAVNTISIDSSDVTARGLGLHAINGMKSVSITGGSMVKATGKYRGVFTRDSDPDPHGVVTITDSAVEAEGENHGISATGGLTITNSAVTSKGTGNNLVRALKLTP